MAHRSQAGDYNPITYCRLSPHKLFSSFCRAWGQASLPNESGPLCGYRVTEGPIGPGESNLAQATFPGHIRTNSTETSISPNLVYPALTISDSASHLLNL